MYGNIKYFIHCDGIFVVAKNVSTNLKVVPRCIILSVPDEN